jgi:hypothetical protein
MSEPNDPAKPDKMQYYPPVDPGYVQQTSAVVGTGAVAALVAGMSSPAAQGSVKMGGTPEILSAGLSWSALSAHGGWNLLAIGLALAVVSVGLNWLSLYIRYKKPHWSFLMRSVDSTPSAASQRAGGKRSSVL